MEKLKKEFTSEGILMHTAVIALIEKGRKYFIVERATLPSGFALVTGHVDEGESAEEAIIREVKEEIGFNVIKHKLIFEGIIDDSACNKRAELHRTFVFECEVRGDVKLNKDENKSYGWYSKNEIKKLRLGEFWERILKIIEFI